MPDKFSIVIPTFNSKTLAPETVESALSQTYPDIEVVIDDNTSRDGTPQLLSEKFGHDPRFHLFANGEDLNIPRGWNRGMGHATGDYSLLLHSDNLLHPKYVEFAVGMMRRFDADVVYSECEYFDGNTPKGLFSDSITLRDLPFTFLSPGSRAIDYIFRFQRMIPTSCVSIRKNCFQGRPPFDPRFLWDPDIELMTWLAKRFRVVHLHHPLAAIRTHDGQAASWKDPSFTRQYEELLKLANQEGKSEPHHFMLNWAWSNQDVCEKLSGLKQVPLRTYLKYQWKWFKAESSVYGHFLVYYLRKLKLMAGFFKRRVQQ